LIETIKSYLVSLGFSVDQSAFHKATTAIDSVEKSVSKFAGKTVVKFGAAAAAVTSFVAAANVGIAKFLGGLAQADLENQKLARQLWTTEDQAASFNNTLKAMGVTMQDLYLSPELMKNFRELRTTIKDLRPPEEYSRQMKEIRSIQFEFTKMKLEATYAFQWIGHYLVKYLAGPLGDIKKKLSDFNALVIKEMPRWTEKVAKFLAGFVQAGVTIVRVFKDAASGIEWLLSRIPTNVKMVGGALAGLAAIIASGPFGIMIALLTAAVLLLDDFYTYLDGGESALGPIWDKLTSLYDQLKDDGTLAKLEKSFTGIFESVSKVIDEIFKLVKSIFGEEGAEKALKAIADISFASLITALDLIKGSLDYIADVLRTIKSLVSGTFFEDAKKMAEEGRKALEDSGYAPRSGFSQEELEDFNKSSDLEKGITWNKKIFGNMFSKEAWQDMWDFFFDPQSGERNKNMFKVIGGSMIGGMPSNYTGSLYGPPAPTVKQTNTNTLHQTNNIYGSDPQATANSIVDQSKYWMRGIRGVSE